MRYGIITIGFKFDPLAQAAEHMTFNHGVRSSSPRWVTKKENPNRFASGNRFGFFVERQ